jgi:putative PIN family toxin of toxin-antitoxin system
VKAVFDTNILISAIFWRGSPYRCLLAAQAGLVDLYVSPPILAELVRVLQAKFQLPTGQIDQAVAIVRGAARVVEITGTVQVVPDGPSDDKFVETAQIAGVDYLVSGDQHLLACRSTGEVRVVTARVFLDILSQASR